MAVAAFLMAPGAFAKVTAEQASRLGKDLTPVGAEAGPSDDGLVPRWTPTAQHGKPGGETAYDPSVEADKPLFTIRAADIPKYKGKLSAGHEYLLKTFDTYRLNVYPSHRNVAWPDFIYKSTSDNATNCVLLGTDDPDNCRQGFPFPIPGSGAEVIWNHRVKWRGNTIRRNNDQMIVERSGRYQVSQLIEDVKFLYANEKNPVPLIKGKGLFLYYLAKLISPPRVAGTMILVNESGGAGATGRAAWVYAPALKRIRRAPAVCCDNPSEGSDGQQFYDQVDMFNGTLERYTWKLLGKREMIVPYNNFKIARTKYADLARANHLNVDLPRYEHHRVWVVEATLKPGERHTYARRVFYVDEDSWSIVMVDCYDGQGALFNFQEGMAVAQYSVLTHGTVPEVIYHFDSGRYFVTALQAEGQPNNYTVQYPDSFFTDSGVQQRASK